MGEAATKVSGALNQAGYTDQGWFVVGTKQLPGNTVLGFAVVTRLEQVDDQGKATPHGTRWAIDPFKLPTSFPNAITLLLKGAPNGRYRVFLIWVSNLGVAQSAYRAEGKDWATYLQQGTKAPLIQFLDGVPVLSRGAGCYVFVYEYERSSIGGEVRFVTSGLTASQHMKASGIWDALHIPPGN